MSSKNLILTSAVFGLVGLVGLGTACTGEAVDNGFSGPQGGGRPPGAPGAGNNPGTNPGVPGAPGSNPGVPGAPGSNPGVPGAGNNPGGTPGAGPGAVPAAPSAQTACSNDGKESIGKRSLRRLTISELDATVRAAFGLDRAQWAGPTVPPDPGSIDGFNNNVDRLTVGPDYERGLLESSRAVARVVSSREVLGKLLPCGLGTGDGTTMVPCAAQFVQLFGPKLYRRPLTQAESMRYADLMLKTGRAAFTNFAYWATLTMLQSPRFLYRSELGTLDAATGKYKLSSYEIASALSYTFTGGPPAPDLMMLAAANRLQTPDDIEAAARNLVYDAGGKVKPAFAAIMQSFVSDWVGLSTLSNIEKDPTAFPGFKAVQDAMAEETRRFVSASLLETKGTPVDLLTAPYTVVNSALAQYYGLQGAGADYTKVARPPGWGVGLLGQGSFLSVEAHGLKTSPTKRGYFVRTRLLCHVVPPPPPVVGDLPPPTEGETTRQRYEMLHAANPGCKACHQSIDQIGFAFEHLDATGRYRDKEGRFDIDDSGVVTNTSAGDLTFKGATEMATAVSKLPEVADCVGSYAAAYAFGVDKSNATCLITNAAQKLRSGASLVDFFISMVRSEHFRFRNP